MFPATQIETLEDAFALHSLSLALVRVMASIYRCVFNVQNLLLVQSCVSHLKLHLP